MDFKEEERKKTSIWNKFVQKGQISDADATLLSIAFSSFIEGATKTHCLTGLFSSTEDDNKIMELFNLLAGEWKKEISL